MTMRSLLGGALMFAVGALYLVFEVNLVAGSKPESELCDTGEW